MDPTHAICTLPELDDNNKAWFAVMRRYFLGFILPYEVEDILRATTTTTPEDVEIRKAWFDSQVKGLTFDAGFEPNHILEPARRKFFFHVDDLLFARADSEDKLFRVKTVPDHGAAVPNGKHTFDLRFLEEVGFVEYPAMCGYRPFPVLIGRTIQPYLVYDTDGNWTHQMIEPVVLVIPKQTERDFMFNFPFIRTMNHDGVVASGDFISVELKPQVVEDLGLPTNRALVHVGIKKRLEATKARSKMRVDRAVYAGIVA